MNNYDYLIETLVTLELLRRPTIQALQRSVKEGDSVVDLALRKRKITASDFYLAKATHFGMEFMPNTKPLMEILPKVVALINPVVAWQLRIIPVKVDGSTVTAYLSDPEDLNSFDTFCHLVGLDNQVSPVVVTESHLNRLLKKYYPSGEKEGKKKRSGVADTH